MKNKKLKLEVVTKYFYPVAAGIETNILETYAYLTDDFDITIHTTTNSLTKNNIYKNKDKVKGLRVIRYKFKSELAGFSPKLDFQNADLICMHNFNVFYILLMCKTIWLKITRRKNYALILTPHGGFNPDWSIFPFFTGLIKRIYHFTIGVFLINLSVDGVRAVSEWEKDQLIKSGVNRNKIEVISNGIEREAFEDLEINASQEIKDRVKSWGKYIIQIGRVYPIKNYETTLIALAKLPKAIKYVIVGPVEINKNPDYVEKLNKIIKENNLEKRVIFAGVIRGVDKYYCIKKARMMVHMSKWESFCNVVHEAMSQATPVIASDNTALKFLIKDRKNGFLTDTYDSDKLSKKTLYILNPKNKKRIKEITKHAQLLAKNETWEKTAGKMASFYKSKIIHPVVDLANSSVLQKI